MLEVQFYHSTITYIYKNDIKVQYLYNIVVEKTVKRVYEPFYGVW